MTLSKYGHGLPLNRQEAIWELHGHRLPRSTTAGWVEATAELLAPVVERIRVRALSSHVLHCDDTGICVLDRDHPKGSKRGHLWVYLGDEEWAVYDYTPNWTKAGPVRFSAGAYAYGKSHVQTKIIGGTVRKTYGRSQPRAAWTALVRDHHEAYISWEQFERNQERLSRNNFGKRAGGAKAARGGAALLGGLLRCRRCGRIR